MNFQFRLHKALFKRPCHICPMLKAAHKASVEPPKKGQIGIRVFVLYSEAVPNWEVSITISTLIICSIVIQKVYFRYKMCVYTLIHCSLAEVSNNLFSRAVPKNNHAVHQQLHYKFTLCLCCSCGQGFCICSWWLLWLCFARNTQNSL